MPYRLLIFLVLAAGAMPAAAQEIGEVCARQADCDRPVIEGVERAQWGNLWPIKVDRAVIVCARRFGAGGQIVIADGVAWAANGATTTLGEKAALRVQVDGRWLSVREFDGNDGSHASKLRDDWGDWGGFIRAAEKLGCGR